MIVLALMAVFAVELAGNQATSRHDIEAQAHERAVLVSGLIDNLFQAVSQPSAQALAQYSAPRVSPAIMNRNRGANLYLALLDPSGRVIAASRGLTPAVRAELTPETSDVLRLIRSGQRWALGSIRPYGAHGVINFGARLATPDGPRILVTGFSPVVLSRFLIGDLQKVPAVKRGYHSLLDGNGVIIASTNPLRPVGYTFHTAAERHVLSYHAGVINEYYFDQVALPNTTWKLLLSAPAGAFFGSVSGLRHWLPWVIFGAFALVCLIALILARRAWRDGQVLTETHAQLELAHAKMGDMNARLAETNATLERTNQELERRAQELARSNADLDHFASIASHDLQEPLRKVRTFTERIHETEGEHLSEQGREYLRRANVSAARMQHLIEDLLKYSRAATEERAFSSVNLGELTAEVLDDLDTAIQRSRAVIRVGALPTISADPTQMRQLMQNLLSNAIKFRREGVTPAVDVQASLDEGWVKLVVRDNGIGFEPQYARRIFRVFERLHGRGPYPGTGIGLALCRKIAERHGGTVIAQSVLGEGSTFTVTLQTRRTEPVALPAPADDAGGPAHPEESYVAA